MLSEHDKQTLAMQADYCVVKIDGLTVYAPVGTEECRNRNLLLLVPISLPLPRQVTLIFLLKCCPTVKS